MWFKSYEHFHKLITTGRTDAQLSVVHQKGCYACQWLSNVDMHTYANFDQNIPRGERVMSILTGGRADRRTHTE